LTLKPKEKLDLEIWGQGNPGEIWGHHTYLCGKTMDSGAEKICRNGLGRTLAGGQKLKNPCRKRQG